MSKQKQDQGDPQLIVDDPYLFEQCQIDIHLALFPLADGADSRRAALSVSSHGDAPAFQVVEDAEVLIENLTGAVRDLLTRFRAELPDRHLSRLRRTAESKARKKKKTTPSAGAAAKSRSEPPDSKVSPKKQLTLLGG
jgi:hypothetical protein